MKVKLKVTLDCGHTFVYLARKGAKDRYRCHACGGIDKEATHVELASKSETIDYVA